MLNLLSFQSVLETVLSVVLALAILLIMITVHEFGHYIAGKILGFKINEFAIGMGPAIFKRKKKDSDEVFSVRILPLGGFCAFEGEDEDSQADGAFNTKAPWKRLIVLVSGALMNLILGVIILILSVGIYGQILIQTYDVRPSSNPEYQNYSLVDNDVILEVEGKRVFLASDLLDALNGKLEGDVVTVKVNNDGTVYERQIKLRNSVGGENLTDSFSAFTALGVSTIERLESVANPELLGTYLLRLGDNVDYNECTRIFYVSDLVNYAKTLSNGQTLNFYVLSGEEKRLVTIAVDRDLSSLTDQEILSFIGINETKTLLKYATKNVKFGFFETISRGFAYSISIGGTIFRTLGELLTGKLGISAMGGPVTTITVTTQAIKQGGFNYFFEMMGFIGINLGVFNLLPIPALDGSRIVFTVIEWIRRKPVNRKVEGIIHTVGLLLLLGFSVLVDVLQIF